MKKWCKYCGELLRARAMGTMHPRCAALWRFEHKHGGRPVWCFNREGMRMLSKETGGKMVDAGAGRIHQESTRFFPGGTRWAVALRTA